MTQEERLRQSFSKGLMPPPNLRLWEWADKFRKLPKKASHEFGQWRTSRFPFTKEVMDVLSPQDPCREVCAMKGSQVAFTEISINRILYNIHLRPVPHLAIQKDIGLMIRFSKQRLQDSINLIPEIYKKLTNVYGKESSDTQLLKSYPGGILILGGANKAASLRSMPISDLDVDEWDSFKADVDSEGDPAELAVRRTANFPNRKIFYLSSPGKEETSKIEPKFLDGDQRYYYVVCPGCGWKAPFAWSKPGEYGCFTIVYQDDNPHTVTAVCANCGLIIEERQKTFMMSEENGAEWVKHNPKGLFPSFHISALYSPYGFYSWQEAVKLWLKANKNFDKELLQVFTNTVLGESFAEGGKELFVGTDIERREQYPAEVPNGGKVLTCGVDIQKNRIELEVVAFGVGQESWSIDYQVFMGDIEFDDVWKLLDVYLTRIFKHESGLQMRIALTMIDSKYKTEKVSAFCKYRQHRGIYPIQGFPGWGKGVIDRPKNKNARGVFQFKVLTDETKSKFYSQLKKTEKGPGFCHFPLKDVYNENYFAMITSERLSSRKIRGVTILEYILPKGKRNEALDCRCYAIAALYALNPDIDAIAQHNTIILGPPIKKTKSSVLSKGVQHG